MCYLDLSQSSPSFPLSLSLVFYLMQAVALRREREVETPKEQQQLRGRERGRLAPVGRAGRRSLTQADQILCAYAHPHLLGRIPMYLQSPNLSERLASGICVSKGFSKYHRVAFVCRQDPGKHRNNSLARKSRNRFHATTDRPYLRAHCAELG